jgi:HEPN domain-containing protein
MTNPDLARDYFTRAQKRLKAIAVLLDERAFADVVRESQEVVELLLKAALRHFGIPVPFSHEPSQSFVENAERLPDQVRASIPRWSEISRKLRRDRELAFYGSEDVTPSSFYTRADAVDAKAMAEEILSGLDPLLGSAPSLARAADTEIEDSTITGSGARRDEDPQKE